MKPPLFGQSWDAPASWLLTFTADQLRENFIQPLIGNGLFATRVGELGTVSDSPRPLLSLSKIIFDEGPQRALPEWARMRIEVEGCNYSLSVGRHDLTHTLDLRTGEVTVRDRWEYRPGNAVDITINLLVLRSHRHGATLRVAIRPAEKTASPRLRIAFGLNGEHVASAYRFRFERPADDTLLGCYETTGQQRRVCQGLLWKTDGHTSAAFDNPVSAALETTSAGTLSLDLFHTFHTYAEGPGEDARTLANLRLLAATPREKLEAENLAAWKPIWSRALAFPEGTPEQQRDLLIHQFNLLTSLGEGAYPLGACGLGQLAWGGYAIWDADMWIFQAILPLWPEMARSILDFRFKGLEAARAYAQSQGRGGAWFPWCTGQDGESRTKHDYVREIHTGIWIALGCRDYHRATQDAGFLRDQAWPLVSAIADFYASWAELGPDGRWHLNGVIGPDEAVTEDGPGSCDDHFLINLGVRFILRYAGELAREFGHTPSARWSEVERNIVIPAPGPDGVVLEHRDYRGERIKQADVILAFWLFSEDVDARHALANVDYYRQRTWNGGPLMTSQIEAMLLMRHGGKEAGLRHLFAEYAPFVRGLHRSTFECRPADNQNYHFLTAMAGLLIALVVGHYGYKIGADKTLPRLGDFWANHAPKS